MRGGRRAGTGSAVVLTDDGFLLTNAHVVAGMSTGVANFPDGSEAIVDVVGADPLSDLAVLRSQGEIPGAATFGDADHLVVGQLVVAVGTPLGLAGSVSFGVVSGLGRSMPAHSGRASRMIEDVIQTDAALNPGNSGGALADAHARVVGINTAVAGFGLGLAVPINVTTQRIVATLMRDGRVRRAYLGLVTAPSPVPAYLRQRLNRTRAVQVVEVGRRQPRRRSGPAPRGSRPERRRARPAGRPEPAAHAVLRCDRAGLPDQRAPRRGDGRCHRHPRRAQRLNPAHACVCVVDSPPSSVANRLRRLTLVAPRISVPGIGSVLVSVGCSRAERSRRCPSAPAPPASLSGSPRAS